MPAGTRRSKRKDIADEKEDASSATDDPKKDEAVKQEDDKGSTEAEPPIIKKPRKDLADAAAAAATKEAEADAVAGKKDTATTTAETSKEDVEMKEAATAEKEETKEDSEKKAEAEEPKAETKEAEPKEAEKTEAKPPPRKAAKKTDTAAADKKSPPAAAAPSVPADEETDDGAEIPEEPAASWNKHLVELLLYKSQYKSLNVSAATKPSLRKWVEKQRKLYRRFKKNAASVTDLQRQHLTVLEAIEFPFTLKGALHWERFFGYLEQFYAKHGHVLVPRLCEYPGLGDWVVDQRRQYKLMMQGKASGLDTNRIAKLEDLGMVWHVRNRPEWNARYDQLLEYKKKHGDTKVPQHYKPIPGLGKWVAKQREQYRLLQQGKHSFLTADRLEKLNDVGFVWTVRAMTKEEEEASEEKAKAAVKAATTKVEDDSVEV